KLRIALHPRGQSRWIRLPTLVFVIRRWGDRQLLADRLDPVLSTMRVDEREHHFPRRSSSAWAKNADALRSISLARFSSVFSRSSCLTRSRSATAVLRRGSAVASAFSTHDLSVSDVQPIFSAIDRIASHRVGYSWTCSWNSRTARSRTSAGYLFDVFPMAPFSQSDGASGKPGAIQNGRHERMHLTLKQEATKPAAKNFLQQQARFDEFLSTFNEQRPHQALNMKYPAELYSASQRPYNGLPELEYPFHDRTITVTRCGRICMGKLKINLSQA